MGDTLIGPAPADRGCGAGERNCIDRRGPGTQAPAAQSRNKCDQISISSVADAADHNQTHDHHGWTLVCPTQDHHDRTLVPSTHDRRDRTLVLSTHDRHARTLVPSTGGAAARLERGRVCQIQRVRNRCDRYRVRRQRHDDHVDEDALPCAIDSRIGVGWGNAVDLHAEGIATSTGTVIVRNVVDLETATVPLGRLRSLDRCVAIDSPELLGPSHQTDRNVTAAAIGSRPFDQTGRCPAIEIDHARVQMHGLFLHWDRRGFRSCREAGVWLRGALSFWTWRSRRRPHWFSSSRRNAKP